MPSSNAPVWEDPRVRAGFKDQFARRADLLDGGAKAIGWKVGYGSPAMMKSVGTTGPLVGYMTTAGQLEDGAEVAIGDWHAAKVEPEVAVRMGADLAPEASLDEAQSAIGALAVAIELVDMHLPPENLPEVVADNIFHRNVLLGEFKEGASFPDRVEIYRNGEFHSASDDPSKLPGEPRALLAHVAAFLVGADASLKAGDIVILGSSVPPIDASPGEDYEVRFGSLGSIGVKLRA